VRRQRPTVTPFGRATFNDQINATCAMSASSGVDLFRFSTQQLFPSLAAATRSIRIAKVNVTIPPMEAAQNKCPKVQFFWNDPVTGVPTALTPQKTLRLTAPTNMRVSIPNFYSQFYPTNSTAPLVLLVFTFTGEEKSTFNVTIRSTAHLGFEEAPRIVPTRVTENNAGFEMVNSPPPTNTVASQWRR